MRCSPWSARWSRLARRFAQQTTGNITGRIVDAQGAAVPGVTVTAKNTQTGFSPFGRQRRGRRLPAERAAGRHLRPDGRTLRASARSSARASSSTSASRSTSASTMKVAGVQENVTVTGETPLIETRSSSVGGVVDVGADREPAAQRPAVREPGGDDPRRRPRLPLGSDQELAVLAADQRRQRPQRQLPDRRRRQQRRHRRRAAAEVPARGDPGVQLRHAALQGRVRPQQRRRDEHRHQERHQRAARQLLHAVPRQGAERARRFSEKRSAGADKQRVPPLPVRRIVRRADRPEQGALLRRRRADAAGHQPGGRHRRRCSPTQDGIYADPVRENAAHRQGDLRT